MPRSILCTIDFSQSSRQVVRWSVTLARELQAHLTLLYTYRLVHVKGQNALQLKKKMEDDALQNFGSLEKEMLTGTGISYDFKSEVGFIADRVEDHVKKNAIDFLVMNKNISEESKEAFEELVEHLQIPMIIVPAS
jgi:hypothetical protein